MSRQDMPDTSPQEIRRLKLWLWVAGLASIALGAIGIASPFVLTLTAELLFGAMLAVLGAVQIVRGLFGGDVGPRWWTVLFGTVSLAGGAVLLLYPLQGVVVLTAVLATYFLIGGVLKLYAAWRMRPAGRVAPGLFGVRGARLACGRGRAVAGAGSWCWPSVCRKTAAWALGLLLGIDLLFLGASEIALALGLNGHREMGGRSMITIEHDRDRDRIVVRASGVLSARDYDHAIPEIEHAMELSRGPLRVMLRLEDFRGWEMGALWRELRFDLGHRGDFGRIAVIGETDLEDWGNDVGGPLREGRNAILPDKPRGRGGRLAVRSGGGRVMPEPRAAVSGGSVRRSVLRSRAGCTRQPAAIS